jgi:hypothetical protein
MTDSTGAKKKYRKEFAHISKQGSRTKRREFIDTDYVDGVLDQDGNVAIRPLSAAENKFLSSFYKEFVHATFKTSEESKLLFRRINSLLSKHEEFFEENGFYPVEVENLIADFDVITKKLGNLHNFWQQKDINSDDYKRGHDIENVVKREHRYMSYEDMQEYADMEEKSDTEIEDLITESEE